MATNLQALAFEKAEILSSRLKEIISSGQGYIQNQLGLDLGLNPDVYPTWVLLSTAAVGLLVVLVLSWVAICGGVSVGKTRGSSLTKVQVEEPLKANLNNIAKPDEQKRKNKKKSSEKKGQSNGRQFSVPQEETASSETSSQQPPAEILPVKVEQAPVQVKKNKKKAKAVVRPVISVITSDETEPDEGAWQTQVSQRERRQQRKKDKAPEDAGSPGGTKTAPRTHVETPATSTNRSRGPPGRKGDPSTNGGGAGGGGVGAGGGGGGGGGGRVEVCSKPPGQSAGVVEREKWSTRVQRHRAQPEAKLWGQDKQVTRSAVEGRTNTGVKPTTLQGLKPAEHASLPVALQWDIHPDDEWCGLNGAMAGDAGSDWSAPLVHWGHYEGPSSPVVAKGPSPKEQPGPHKVSAGEKVAEDSVGGTKSTKRKKKKNKNVDEGAITGAQVGGTIPKAQEAPAVTTNKQSVKRADSEKKSEQRTAPLRPGQKKRA